MKPTPEQMQIVIAERCGWKDLEIRFTCKTDNPRSIGTYLWGFNTKEQETEPPNYLEDLNAMHEAEKVLTYQQKQEYWSELSANLGTRGCIMATALQRAKAFCRTVKPELFL